MSTNSFSSFRYRQPRIAYAEDVEKYCPGGYHPVDIGDVICTDNQDYEVIHKLGHGGFSTVWLVRPCVIHEPSYFALKILRADVGDVPELGFLQHLKKVAGPGHPNVVTLYDSFKVSGPNGEHHCLVFPVLGPSLQKMKAMAALSSSTRHGVCQQIASAMAFLHHHGICHGDLTASNVLFDFPNVQTVSAARIFHLFGPVQTENLRLLNGSRSPHAPKRVVKSADPSGLDCSMLARIRIVDFGQAFFAHRPPMSLGVPIDFFPPELCFGYLPSTKSDVWHLACLLYQVQSSKVLFPAFFQIFELLIGTIVEHLGPLPEQWRGRFKFSEYGYCEPAQIPKDTEPEWWYENQQPNKIVSRLACEAAHLSTGQRVEYARLIQDMTAYEPEKRLSAIDVIRRLRSERFTDDNPSE